MTNANTASSAYVLAPLSAAASDELRRIGGEIYVADAHPGYPCRQCLRDGEIGDEVILVSHDPFDTSSPYRSASPIFIHREDCGSPDPTGLPLQLTVRQLSVRAFDRAEMMIDATVIDGSELDTTLTSLLESPEVRQIHVHNAQRGCWATAVVRAD